MERRSNDRIECLIPVNRFYGGACYSEMMMNRSDFGVYLRSSEVPPVGKELGLIFRYPETGTIKRLGTVVWKDFRGMGISLR